jgi:hypothetical protein
MNRGQRRSLDKQLDKARVAEGKEMKNPADQPDFSTITKRWKEFYKHLTGKGKWFFFLGMPIISVFTFVISLLRLLNIGVAWTLAKQLYWVLTRKG